MIGSKITHQFAAELAVHVLEIGAGVDFTIFQWKDIALVSNGGLNVIEEELHRTHFGRDEAPGPITPPATALGKATSAMTQ